MIERSLFVKLLAAGLILSVPNLCIAGGLSGTIVSASDQTPLGGVKLHAADPKTGRIYSSPATGEDGSFAVESLPPATYELAVEADGGLYLIQAPLQLAPGKAQRITVAVNRDQGDDEDDDDKGGAVPQGGKIGGISIWDNPLTAAGLVIGLAFVIGVLIDNATDDPVPSPSS